MQNIYIGNKCIYAKTDKIDIFNKNLKQLKTFMFVDNVAIYNDLLVHINNKEAKIYKQDKLYHTLELPKEVSKFVINDYFIISFDNSMINVISLIGNKVVLSATVSKMDIQQVILKDTYLFIRTKSSISILDVIQKKIIFKLAIDSTLFDTDGENIVVYNNSYIYKIDLYKRIEKISIDMKLDEIKLKNNLIYFRSDTKLFVLKNKLIEITKNCHTFDVDDEYVYSLEHKIKKYQIETIGKTNTIKFLTVDDSVTMRMIIKNSILNNFSDVEVFEAKDGKKALEMLELNPDINVIFMDWNMPIMDGKEAVIKIRENPKYDKIKIIMATTEGGKEKVREMINYGVKGYLVKPLKPASVVPVVEKMIELVQEEKNV